MTQQSHYWAYIQRKTEFKNPHAHNICCGTIYNSQAMETSYMSIDRGMSKEDVVYTHKEILLSHKKEQNWFICGDMDELFKSF